MANENGVRIAYLLLAHKSPEQLNLFIRQLLDYGDCDVYVHVDVTHKEICEQLIRDDRVIVCSEFETRWASFDICKAALKLMTLANESGKYYSHFYFGSGQDLLVKKGLYEYLAEHEDKIFLRIIREVTEKDKASARYKVRWSRKLMVSKNFHVYRLVRKCLQMFCRMGIVIHRNKKTLNRKVKFYTGGTWFVAPMDVLRYILKYMEENPDYEDFWEDSLASDLMFFQTVIMNSQYAENIEPELMYIHWGDNHPLNVTADDNETIESGNYYCARKFDLSDRASMEFYLNKTSKDR